MPDSIPITAELLDSLADRVAQRLAQRLDPDRTMSATEAADFCGIDYKRLLTFRRAGAVPFLRMGKSYGFRRGDLIDFRDKFIRTTGTQRNKRG